VKILDTLLAKRGATRDSIGRHSRVGKALRREGVPACAEWQRVDALPRRAWSEDPELDQVAAEMTAWLKTPTGTQSLWTIQAIALAEIMEQRGLVGGIRVSGGKTLIALLAPTVLDLPRPLIFVPAKSIKSGKADKAYREARQHWRVRTDIQFVSYETLQQSEYADMLERYRPGVVIADEAHKWGRHDSGRTSRMQRFIDSEHGAGVPRINLSGTLLASHVVKDVARLCEWSLGAKSPLPRTKKAQKDWADALEVRADALGPRMKPGALARWCKDDEAESLDGLRRAYGRRYIQTPGVVVSSGDALGQSLVIDVKVNAEHDKAVEDVFEKLRGDPPRAPDDWILVDAPVIWSVAQQLELGFYYQPKPRPPAEWTLARQNWASYCRERIAHGDEVDTELRVANECRAMGDDAPHWWTDWIAIRDTFRLEVEPVWLSDRRVDQAAEWLKKHGGLCWSQFTAFSRRLSQKHRIPYFGAEACDEDGNSILEYPGGPAIVSIAACSEDLNLQDRWHSNLVVAPPSTGQAWEQFLARTHRFGQQADEVTCEAWVGCLENRESLDRALEKERAVAQASHDDARKLLVADWIDDGKIPHVRSRRWSRPSKK